MRPAAMLLLIPAIFATLTVSAAAPQAGHFDLENTKTVVSGLIEQAMKDRGVRGRVLHVELRRTVGDWRGGAQTSSRRGLHATTPAQDHLSGSGRARPLRRSVRVEFGRGVFYGQPRRKQVDAARG